MAPPRIPILNVKMDFEAHDLMKLMDTWAAWHVRPSQQLEWLKSLGLYRATPPHWTIITNKGGGHGP